MDKLLFKRILIGLLIIGIVSYIIYLFAGSNFSKAVETEETVNTEISDTIYTDAFIIRNEKYIENNVSGVLSFNVNNGDNVSVDQNIADIYQDENDAVARQKIDALTKQIKALKTLGESYYKDSISLDTANTQINNNIYSIKSSVISGDLNSAKTSTDDLLMSICERQMITGDAKNFKSKISELRAQRDKYEASSSESIGAITTPDAGYFVSEFDGFENSFDVSKLKKIDLDDLNSVKSIQPDGNVIGKVVSDPEWYIACKITSDESIMLSKILNEGSSINVLMSSASNKKIPASIYSINQHGKDKDGVLILSCDYMNNYIASARKEPVEIITSTYSGLKVSKRAIHEDYVKKEVKDSDGKSVEKKKNVQGVYVLHGSELIFKEISIVYSGSDYVICNPIPEDGVLFNGETIELYDQVVIKGDNLYDGKVIR